MKIVLGSKVAKKTQEESDSSSNCLKEFTKRPVSKLLLELSTKNMVRVRFSWRNLAEILEIRIYSASHRLDMTQQTFVYQTFAFPSSCELPSSSLRSQTPTAASSFVCWRWYLRWRLQSFWRVTQFSWVSPMNTGN